MRSLGSFGRVVSLLGCLIAIPAHSATTDGLGAPTKMFGLSFQTKPGLGAIKYFEANDEGTSVQVRFIPAPHSDAAEAYIDDKIALFESIYQAKRVDYPGQFSRSIDCPNQYKPKYLSAGIPRGKLSYFVGFANANRAPGACTADLVHFMHFYGFLYCTQLSTVIEIEGFFPRHSEVLERFIKNISCDM